jgi:hypothetical protein
MLGCFMHATTFAINNVIVEGHDGWLSSWEWSKRLFSSLGWFQNTCLATSEELLQHCPNTRYCQESLDSPENITVWWPGSASEQSSHPEIHLHSSLSVSLRRCQNISDLVHAGRPSNNTALHSREQLARKSSVWKRYQKVSGLVPPRRSSKNTAVF